MISSKSNKTDDNEEQRGRDSTITHPRSSKIQDPNENIGESDGQRSRSHSDATENKPTDHSRSSSTSSDRSDRFNGILNGKSNYSDQEEDDEVQIRKGNHDKTIA